MKTLPIVRPGAGEKRSVSLGAGQSAAFAFNMADAAVDRTGNDLIFRFDDGAETGIQNFFVVANGAAPPVFVLEDGAEVASADVLRALNSDLDFSTAAGPGAGASSGGAGEYAADAGDLVGGVDRLASLGAAPAWTPAGASGAEDGFSAATIARPAAGLPGTALPAPGGPGGDGDTPDSPVDNAPGAGVDDGPGVSVDDGAKPRVVVGNIGEDFFRNTAPGIDNDPSWEIADADRWVGQYRVSPYQGNVDQLALSSGRMGGASLGGVFTAAEMALGVRFRLSFVPDNEATRNALKIQVNGKSFSLEDLDPDGDGYVTLPYDAGHEGDHGLSLQMPGGDARTAVVSEFSIGESDIENQTWARGEVSGENPVEVFFINGEECAPGEPVDLEGILGEKYAGYSFTMDADGHYTYKGGPHFPPDLDVNYTLAGGAEEGRLHLRGHAADAREDASAADGPLVGSVRDDVLVAHDAVAHDDGRAVSGQEVYGERGNDLIHGGSGDDVIYGGRGNDVLTGGAGGDVFAWKSSDMYLNERDVILDFSQGEGDTLRFHDLLEDGQSLDSLLGNGLTASVKDDLLEIRIAMPDHLLQQTVDVNFSGGITVQGNSYKDFGAFADAYADAGADAQQAMLSELLKSMTG